MLAPSQFPGGRGSGKDRVSVWVRSCAYNESVLELYGTSFSTPTRSKQALFLRFAAHDGRYNTGKNCQGVGVRLGGAKVDKHQYGQDNDVSERNEYIREFSFANLVVFCI